MSAHETDPYSGYSQMTAETLFHLDKTRPVPKSPVPLDGILEVMSSHGFHFPNAEVTRIGLNTQGWQMVIPDPNCMPFTLFVGNHRDTKLLRDSSSTILTSLNEEGRPIVQIASAMLDSEGNRRVVAMQYGAGGELEYLNVSLSDDDELPTIKPNLLQTLERKDFQTVDLRDPVKKYPRSAGLITPAMVAKTDNHSWAVRFDRHPQTGLMVPLQYGGFQGAEMPVDNIGLGSELDENGYFIIGQSNWSLKVLSSLKIPEGSTS